MGYNYVTIILEGAARRAREAPLLHNYLAAKWTGKYNSMYRLIEQKLVNKWRIQFINWKKNHLSNEIFK